MEAGEGSPGGACGEGGRGRCSRGLSRRGAETSRGCSSAAGAESSFLPPGHQCKTHEDGEGLGGEGAAADAAGVAALTAARGSQTYGTAAAAITVRESDGEWLQRPGMAGVHGAGVW